MFASSFIVFITGLFSKQTSALYRRNAQKPPKADQIIRDLRKLENGYLLTCRVSKENLHKHSMRYMCLFYASCGLKRDTSLVASFIFKHPLVCVQFDSILL